LVPIYLLMDFFNIGNYYIVKSLEGFRHLCITAWLAEQEHIDAYGGELFIPEKIECSDELCPRHRECFTHVNDDDFFYCRA